MENTNKNATDAVVTFLEYRDSKSYKLIDSKKINKIFFSL